MKAIYQHEIPKYNVFMYMFLLFHKGIPVGLVATEVYGSLFLEDEEVLDAYPLPEAAKEETRHTLTIP